MSFADIYKDVKNIINAKTFVAGNSFSLKTAGDVSFELNTNLSKNITAVKFADRVKADGHEIVLNTTTTSNSDMKLDLNCKNLENGAQYSIVSDLDKSVSKFRIGVKAPSCKSTSLEANWDYEPNKTNNVTVNGTYKFDSFTVGAQAVVNPLNYGNPAELVNNVEVAARYVHGNLTSAVHQKGSILSLGVTTTTANKVKLATEVIAKVDDGTTNINVGAECNRSGATYNARYSSGSKLINLGVNLPVHENVQVKLGAELDTSFGVQQRGVAVDFTF